MQTLFQIAIGMIPLFFIVILMSFRKKHRILSTGILLIVGIALYIVFQSPLLPKNLNESKDQKIYLTQKYMELGDYDESKDLLNQLVKSYGESFVTAINQARMLLLQGKIEAAGIQYEKAMLYQEKKNAIPKRELEFVQKIINGEVTSITSLYQTGAITTYIESVGGNPEDYGFDATAPDYLDMAEAIDTGKSKILNSISDEIEEFNDNENAEALEEGIELKYELNTLVDLFAQSGAVDEEQAKSVARNFEDLYEEAPELFVEGLLEDSYLEAMILNQDYETVVELAESGNLDALLMVASLYQNQKIDENSFSDDFLEDKADAYEDVVGRCEDILSEYEEDMPSLERADAKEIRNLTVLTEKVETLNRFLDDLALSEVCNRAEEQLPEVREENISKTLLQLAGINYYLGNTVKGDSKFEEALEKASYCKDENFTEPLYHIMEVLSGNEEESSVKDTTIFAKQAYLNATSPVLAEDGQGAAGFTSSVTNYVSTKTAMLNIGSIDTSNFPTISVDLQFGKTPENLNSILEVLDAEESIKNYKLTKKEYTQSDIILVCDMSGSMSGSEGALQSAISQFIDQMAKKENISLIGFDDIIQFDTGFTKDKNTLYDAASRLIPNGGTNIFGALTYSIGTMRLNQDASKIIIVMTDGQDNNMPPTSELNNLSRLCDNGNIIVYTIGMGEVHEAYLSDLAQRGNGQFVYCSEADSLKTLYNFIHTQIDNTYELTFEAVDQTTNKRIFKLTDLENNCSDSKTYYLKSEENSLEGSKELIDYNIGEDSKGIAITGVDQKSIYKSDSMDMPLKALGYGFSKLTDATVSLVSDRKTYKDLPGTIVDDTHISFAVPKGIVLGHYSIEISSNGEKYQLANAFAVYEAGVRGVARFGEYIFEANNVTKTNDGYLLKGNVVLNQYLNFKGDIALSGDINSLNIVMSDTEGAYVNCNRELPGVLKYFYTNTVEVPSFGSITLYNDQMNKYNLEEYSVEARSIEEVTNLDALLLEGGSVSLYPDRVEFNNGRFAFDFPGQKVVFRALGNEELFTFDTSTACVLNAEALSFIAQVNGLTEKGVNLGTLPINLQEFELTIDTLLHDYLIGGSLGIGGTYKELFKDKTFGLTLAWKGGKWETILVKLGIQATIQTPIPVTLENFFFGLEEMSKVEQDGSVGKLLLNAYITGGMDIAVGRLADKIKPLAKVLDDTSLCTFEETKLRTRLNNFSLDLSTKFKLFGEIDMGEAELKIGTFEYDNYLLDMPKGDVTGAYAKLKTGFLWDTSNIYVDVSGEGILTLNNRFSGITTNGRISYDINIWKFETGKDLQGNILIGLHNGGEQFSILIKGSDLRKNKQSGVWVSIDKGSIIPDLKFY